MTSPLCASVVSSVRWVNSRSHFVGKRGGTHQGIHEQRSAQSGWHTVRIEVITTLSLQSPPAPGHEIRLADNLGVTPSSLLSFRFPASEPQGKDQGLNELSPAPPYLGEVSVVHAGEKPASMSHAEHWKTPRLTSHLPPPFLLPWDLQPPQPPPAYLHL